MENRVINGKSIERDCQREITRRQFTTLLAGATVAVGGGVLTACSSTTSDSDAVIGSNADTPKILRVGTTESGGTYYPRSNMSSNTGFYLIYDTVAIREADGSLSPWVAKSWEYVDPKTLVFTLRDDAYFVTGKQITGEDVIYAFRMMVEDPLSALGNAYECIDYDASTVSEDGLTVTFKFKYEYGSFVSQLDVPFLLDKSEVENWAADDERWWDSPLGSGAYEVVENVSGAYAHYKLRTDYWNKDAMPDWDEIIVNYYSDTTAMFVAFENGDIDLVIDVGANDAARLFDGDVANPNSTAYENITSNAAYLFCMSPYKKELEDIKVRKAIAHALDNESIGKVAYGTLVSTDLDSVLPRAVKHYVSCGRYEHDVELAKQCLAESAYPDGFDLNVVIMNTEQTLWEAIQSSLASINVTVTINSYDMPTALGMWMQEDTTDAILYNIPGGNTTLDPDVALSQTSSSGSFAAARVLDPEYNEYLLAAENTTDDQIIGENFAKVQKWLYENYQVLPMFENSYCIAYNTDLISSCDFFSGVRCNLFFCHAVSG